ncbi:unnamed protein product [Polarella glacialis]|uniref:Reverse transcriptase domain-containing protein n=1 Tax=Polarella glacialis TaxID=89957 RepID=A0A813I3S5_POLGL|nr:unnamed protein product [Polarella glacialis]
MLGDPLLSGLAHGAIATAGNLLFRGGVPACPSVTCGAVRCSEVICASCPTCPTEVLLHSGLEIWNVVAAFCLWGSGVLAGLCLSAVTGLGQSVDGRRLQPGTEILLRYDVPVAEWHARILLAAVDVDTWIVLTPDGDIFAEDLGPRNHDVASWRVRVAGLVPFGLNPAELYEFHPAPLPAELVNLFQEGTVLASQERARRSLPPLGAAGGVAAGAVAGGAVVGGLPPLAGAGGAPMAAVAGGGGAALGGGLGLAGLALAIGGGVAHVASRTADAAGGDDARTLTISRDADGNRFKEFREAVLQCRPSEFKDWPIAGPRTVKYVLMQVLEHGGNPIAHRNLWRTACRFQPSDNAAIEHEGWSKVLHTMLSYDQVDASNLAAAELVCRNLQRLEERRKDRMLNSDESGETSLFMGASGSSRSRLLIAPHLQEWIGSELQKEALISKERRKAREERALARKPLAKGAKEDKQYQSMHFVNIFKFNFVLHCRRVEAKGEGSRARELFPLPFLSATSSPSDMGHSSVSKGARAGAHAKAEWLPWANQGIEALNEMSGCAESFNAPRPTEVQSLALQRIRTAYRLMPAPVGEPPPTVGALHELCSSSAAYSQARKDVLPYTEAKVAWPPEGTAPVPIRRCLPEADGEWLGDWRSPMLNNPEEARIALSSAGIAKAYIDPVLGHNVKTYARFIKQLDKRHMLGFRKASGEAGLMGVFCVAKKNGALRLIFDTRLINCMFKPAPATQLPTASAIASVEIYEDIHDDEIFLAAGDLANAFYTLGLPEDLSHLFTLPAIEAGLLGISEISGKPISPDTQLLPFLTVLPMGRSWALRLCQQVLNHAISAAGFKDHQVIADKKAPVIVSRQASGAAGYVDNFAVLGHDRLQVQHQCNQIAKVLRSCGLTVYEEESASSLCDFVGLRFDGKLGTVRIKPDRIRKIRSAIQELLLRNQCSGAQLEGLIGHATWAILMRREGLALLNHSYAFIAAHSEQQVRLWPAVRRELRQVAALCVGVIASDSSPYGAGVCQRRLNPDFIKVHGRQSEKWRYKFEDAMRAREHTFATGDDL